MLLAIFGNDNWSMLHIQGLLLVLYGSNWVQFVCLFGPQIRWLWFLSASQKAWPTKSIGYSRFSVVSNNVSSFHQRGQKFSHQCAVPPSLRHDKTQLSGVSCRFAFVKTRNEGLKSLCSAVEDVDGAKNLIGFCLGRQSGAFLSDSAVHTITSNRLHWLEIANLCLLFSNLWKGSLHYIRPVSWLVDRLVGQCRH